MAPSRGKRSFYTRLSEDGSLDEIDGPAPKRLKHTFGIEGPRRSARIAEKSLDVETARQLSQSGVKPKKIVGKKVREGAVKKTQNPRVRTQGRKKKASARHTLRRDPYPSPPISSRELIATETERYSLSIALQPSVICEPGTPLYPPLTVLLHPQQPLSDGSFDLQTAQLWGMVTLLDSSGEIVAPLSPTKLSGQIVDSPHLFEQTNRPAARVYTPQDDNRSSCKANHPVAEEAYLMFPNLSISEAGDYRLLVSLMEMDPVICGVRRIADVQTRPISVQPPEPSNSGHDDGSGDNAQTETPAPSERGSVAARHLITDEDRLSMDRLRKRGVEMDIQGVI